MNSPVDRAAQVWYNHTSEEECLMTSKKPRLLTEPSAEVAKRLKELRTEGGLTQEGLADELSKHATENYTGILSKSVISNLENRNQNITIEQAIAYSNYFRTSLEYIFALSVERRPENPSITEVTGLSDKAIDVLKNFKMHRDVPPYSEMLNLLCEMGFLPELLNAFNEFLILSISQYDNLQIIDPKWNSDVELPVAYLYLYSEVNGIIKRHIDKLLRFGYSYYQ
jgi:transcriptional regulator with XRE-family HTH domain